MAFIFDIKVIPSSKKNQWKLDEAGKLKCYLKSSPEKGKANKELIKLLAEVLDCPQSYIEIITGHTSRTKKVKIALSLTYDELLHKLALKTGQQSFI